MIIAREVPLIDLASSSDAVSGSSSCADADSSNQRTAPYAESTITVAREVPLIDILTDDDDGDSAAGGSSSHDDGDSTLLQLRARVTELEQIVATAKAALHTTTMERGVERTNVVALKHDAQMHDDELRAVYDSNAKYKRWALRELAVREQCDARIKQLVAQLDTRDAQAETTAEELSVLQAHVADLEAAGGADMAEQVAVLKAHVAELEATLSDKLERVDQLEAILSDLEPQHARVMARKHEYKQAWHELRQANAALEDECDSIRRKLKEQQLRNAKVETANKTQAKRVARLLGIVKKRWRAAGTVPNGRRSDCGHAHAPTATVCNECEIALCDTCHAKGVACMCDAA